MGLEVIIIIIMAIILLLWVIFCGCFIFHRISKATSRLDFKAHVQCEKCGLIYDVSSKEATHSHMTKFKSTIKTQMQNGALVNRPVYSNYAKKFYCPNCGKKTYGQVLNLEEIQDIVKTPQTKEVCRGFIMMAVGGIVILILMQIPMYFADKAKEKRIEQMKEQQYENIRDTYWNP